MHPESQPKVTDLSGQSAAAHADGSEICELRVGGMDCPSCADQIRRSLGALEGVQDVQVDVVGGKVRVGYVQGKLARGDLAGAIRRVGFQVEGGDARKAVFTVREMDCADEVRQIEDQLGKLPGITDLQFDLLNRRLIVEGTITSAEIQRALAQLVVTASAEGEERRLPTFWERRGRLAMALVSGSFLAASLVLGWFGLPDAITIPLLAASAAAGGWFVAPRAWRAVRNRALDMNFLMVIAAIGAAAIGEWAEGASVLFLFSVAQLLETWSMDRARSAIKLLMDLSPTEAVVKRNGLEETVAPADVGIGETILVRPGQKVPLDGEVIAGGSAVNQASITGESLPVDKAPGDEVFAGSINEHGLLEIRATKHVEDTTLARVIHAVEEAQASRAPSQSFVDRFARIYTPAVVILAVAIFVLPPIFGFGSWSMWFYRALAMLVIACPCALVISTPVSIVSGLAGAARAGVLIKGGLHLENAGAVTTVALDKTGTLTQGRPAVTDVVALGGTDQKEVLRLAAAIEQGSEHSLAGAILARASEEGIQPPSAGDFQALVGRGVRATIAGQVLYLGNERLLHEQNVRIEAAQEALQRFEIQGKTAVVLTNGREPLGVIAVADPPRADASRSIAELRASGIRRMIMLTGDNEGTARAVADDLGLDEYWAELLPDDKVQIVRQLEQGGERVAFVGDGVNDAPALATASLGIAIGAAGTDIAIETADIALMADDLSKLSLAIRLGRKTLRVVKQNITFSIALKLVFLALAAGGWATLWMAVVADMGASLLVIFNGLRLLRVR